MTYYKLILSSLLALAVTMPLPRFELVPPAVAADGVFRSPGQPAICQQLGVTASPSLVIVNGARHPGMFIQTVPTTDLGRNMKLAPGMVLLTVDNYSMTDSAVADSWIGHRSGKSIPYTYAVMSGGKPVICSGSTIQQTSAPSDLGIMGPRPRNLQSKLASKIENMQRASGGTDMTDGELTAYTISLINDSRKAGGLPPLQEDAALDNFAHQYADYMAKNRAEYELSSPHNAHQDLMGRNGQERAKAAGMNYFIADNVGRSSRSLGDKQQVANLHIQMMAEPAGSGGHKENIMNPEAKLIGVGIARGDNRLYLEEAFGR